MILYDHPWWNDGNPWYIDVYCVKRINDFRVCHGETMVFLNDHPSHDGSPYNREHLYKKVNPGWD